MAQTNLVCPGSVGPGRLRIHSSRLSRLLKTSGRSTPIGKETVENILTTKLPPSSKNLVGQIEGFQDNLYQARWDMDESEISALLGATPARPMEKPEETWNHSEHDPDWWWPGKGEIIGVTGWKEGPPDFYVTLYFCAPRGSLSSLSQCSRCLDSGVPDSVKVLLRLNNLPL